MSTELVAMSNTNDMPAVEIRRDVLLRLNQAAEEASTPEAAHRVMEQGRLVAEALKRTRQPFEDCWLAGKASVLAARRLGEHLNTLSCERLRAPGARGGFLPSQRASVRDELGLSPKASRTIVRLSELPDPEFQRYIQGRDGIPSIHGALTACHVVRIYENRPSSNWQSARRRRLNVRTPANPSLDEACSLLVKALGHLGAVDLNGGSRDFRRARSNAMDMLYEAHDLLRPFLGGYVA